MEKTQETEQRNSQSNLLALHSVNIFLLIVNFALNFLGSPALKYVYLIHVIVIVLGLLIYDFDQIFFEIITLMFIEGQGRVLWHYQPWSRVAFDIITFLSIAKVFIQRKKIYDQKVVPWPVIVLIALHFLWYIIQFFNVNAVSIFGVLAASKIYIYPIILFLGITLSNLNPISKGFRQMLFGFYFIMILEVCLSYFHFTVKQQHLLSMSSYYYKAMKDGIFTDNLFRPFATTALPGVLAIYIFLTVGFLFFMKQNIKGTIFKWVIIVLSFLTIITCQVRSALVKFLLIIIFIQLGTMFYKRFSLRSILPFFVALIILVVGSQNFLSNGISSEDESLNYAIGRASSLTEVSKVKNDRLNLTNFGKIIIDKISKYPLGVGPGMTGAASSVNQSEIVKNPFIKKEFLWTSDNLIISFALDLGIGGLFLLTLILFIPIYFVKYLLKMYAHKDEFHYHMLLICTSSAIVIIFGNWGAVGLTYNPESFIFWMYAALGFKIIGKYKDAKTLLT
jgi:hypothetical protein